MRLIGQEMNSRVANLMIYKLKQDTIFIWSEGSKHFSFYIWDINKQNKNKRKVGLIITLSYIKVWIFQQLIGELIMTWIKHSSHNKQPILTHLETK